MESPEEIKVEYEKQMSNYKKLRELYEQRAVAAELEHKTMIEKELAKNALLEAKLKEIQEEIQAQLEKYKENKRQILEMEKNILAKDDEINNLNENLTSSLAENHILNSQMTLVNNLFSNMLINPMINLDLLVKLIQDNYLLIIDLVNNHEINDTVSLLVDLEKKIDQETLAIHNRKQMKELENSDGASCSGAADESELNENGEQDKTRESSAMDKSHIQKEIANNLPKVWRILIELLNTHQEQYENNEANENFDSCYKNIKTDSGKTHQVISVSQTFIRLKHLILEKNHLTNQLVKLKTLNNHLEIRLNQSEQRLNTVTSELKKTWNVVNKLKLQHKQLYTHEKILKYELKHKRNIINDLKIDLEYVREKWDLVKEKNEQNEMDYKVLRKEFALRRLQYDGGRSTSESGISTDNEDDNVEIVETNDESEDDKSEVVETQSEHDVPHTNSVMSIEEDDQDEVEELENETNGNESREVQNTTSESVIEAIAVQSEIVPDPSLHEEAIGTSQPGPISLLSLSNHQISGEMVIPDITHLEIEENNRLAPESIPQEPERNPDSGVDRKSEESLSHIVFNNKFTVKTIGGQIKVVTEHISNESSSTECIPSKAESFISNTDIREENPSSSNKTVISCNKENTTANKDKTNTYPVEKETTSPTVAEICEGQRAKQLTRQERIPEETLDAQKEKPESSTSRTANGTQISDSEADSSRLRNESSKDLVNTVQSKVDDLKRVLLARRRSSANASISTESAASQIKSTEEIRTELAQDKSTTEAENASKETLQSKEDQATKLIPPPSPLPTPDTSAIRISESSNYTPVPEASSKKTIPPSESSSNTAKILTSSNNISLSEPSTSSSSRTRTPEEILEARNARLKRLEDQTKNLFHKMSLTSQRSDTLSERLIDLHEYYGSSNDRADRSPRRLREGSSDSDEARLKPIEQREAQSSETSPERSSVEAETTASTESSQNFGSAALERESGSSNMESNGDGQSAGEV